MNTKERILKEFWKSTKNEGMIDFMELVNPEALGVSEQEFSEALYELQVEGSVSNVDFDPQDPHKALMWDRITINTKDFKIM